MEQRKSYSTARETNLCRVVESAVIDLRMVTLRGTLEGLNSCKQEEVIASALADLPARVAEAYRANIKATDQPDLFDG